MESKGGLQDLVVKAHLELQTQKGMGFRKPSPASPAHEQFENHNERKWGKVRTNKIHFNGNLRIEGKMITLT